jgi:hypothetical protein
VRPREVRQAQPGACIVASFGCHAWPRQFCDEGRLSIALMNSCVSFASFQEPPVLSSVASLEEMRVSWLASELKFVKNRWSARALAVFRRCLVSRMNGRAALRSRATNRRQVNVTRFPSYAPDCSAAFAQSNSDGHACQRTGPDKPFLCNRMAAIRTECRSPAWCGRSQLAFLSSSLCVGLVLVESRRLDTARGFKQEPDAAFGLVDPVLDETGGGDVGMLVAQTMSLPQ